ncbi:MAG: AI-2E family transporter [Lachnospiraceae bacterium]|nr:AI-2E family transporter [Lachnospiraceae bacterium]
MSIWERWKKESWFSMTVAICIGILFYTLINNIPIVASVLGGVWTVVKPLLYALIIAYLVDPIARFYQMKLLSGMKKQAIARKISVIIAVLTVIVVLVLIIVAVIPPFIQSIVTLVNHISRLLEELQTNSGELSSILPPAIANIFGDFSFGENALSKVSEYLSSMVGGIANASLTAGSALANILIAFILAIYLLLDKARLQTIGRRFLILVLKQEKYLSFSDFIKKVDNILLSYIKGSMIEALIVGAVNWIFMLIVGMPYAILVSLIVGITNLAPTFGPIVGAVIGAFLLLIEKPVYALIFLIFTVILQTIDGYIIKPRLFGDSLGVSPLLILIMIILGGRVFGVVGILLAIPTAAIGSILANDWWSIYKAKKHIQEPEEDIPDMNTVKKDG